jgi:hypothetical protein
VLAYMRYVFTFYLSEYLPAEGSWNANVLVLKVWFRRRSLAGQYRSAEDWMRRSVDIKQPMDIIESLLSLLAPTYTTRC